MGERRGGGCCYPPMDLMRSEPMQLVQLIIPVESAHLTIAYLGELGLIQFKDVEKNVFVAFFSGERAKNKILKICEAFGANRYPFPEDLSKQVQAIAEVSSRLSELKTTIDAGLLHRGNLLQSIGEQFEQWNLLVRKEKSIYHTLNMLSFDVTKKCLVAEGWSPIFRNQTDSGCTATGNI